LSLDALFRPRRVAVIGASNSSAKAGGALVRTLAAGAAEVFPVNPAGGEIAGVPAYRSVADLPAPADLAVLAIPAPLVPDALSECAAAGTAAAVVCSGDFAEAGAEGASRQAAIAEIVRRTGIRVLGPNTSGFVNPVDGVYATFLTSVTELTPGPVSVVAQSGGMNLAVTFLVDEHGPGVRVGIGLGNSVDVGFVDVLDFLRDDAATRVIVLHIEGVTDGRALFEAVARTVIAKPVVAMKVGRAAVDELSRSHTGALAGDYELTRAALAQAGAVVVDDVAELVDAARSLAGRRAAPSPCFGVGLVTGQAGPGLVIADRLTSAGVTLPELCLASRDRLATLLPPLTFQRNPVDTGRPAATFPEVVATVASDPAIDAVAVYGLYEPNALDLDAAVAAAGNIPVVVGSGGHAEALDATSRRLATRGVPLYRSPDGVARAARALAEDARGAHRAGDRDTTDKAQLVPALGDARLAPEADEALAKDVLDAVGLRTPPRVACNSRPDAHRALRRLGPPVVVKVLDAATWHKSDVGGVHLGVTDAASLDRALDAIDALAAGGTTRYLVEQQTGPGSDLVIGGRNDPVFGPLVLLGLGGTDVELVRAASMRLVPLTAVDTAELVDTLPAPLFLGHRGGSPVDRDELGQVLGLVAALFVDHPEVVELDLNPVRATAEGLVVLDALLIVGVAASPIGDRGGDPLLNAKP
jgi:acetyltransferase